ncbi:MAG: PAS domain S-box protein, partial [Pedobacter sp.]
IQFYNDAYRPSLGDSGKHPAALGQRGVDCWPEIWAVIKPLIDQVMGGGEAVYLEDQMIPIFRNGKLEDVYWTFCYSRVVEPDGSTGGVLVTCHETTGEVDRKKKIEQMLAELAQSEARLSSLIGQAPVGIGMLKSRELVIETANDKILQFWGKDRRVIGTPLSLALPELEGQPFLAILDEVFTSGKAYSSNEVGAFLEKNGELDRYYFDILYQPIADSEGNTEGILVLATDLTAQVKSRQLIEESALQFRQMADSIIQMVWVTDAKGMHEYYNQRWYDFTGSTYEDTKGEGWNQIFHPEDRARAWKQWEHSLATGEPYEIEYRLKNHQGEYVWVLGRAAPFYGSEGNISKWFGTCTDIHQQKLLQQQKDDFISIASHELKTPLTTLKMGMQLLDRMLGEQPERVSGLISRAHKNIDRVSTLITDLLNASKFNHGQLQLNKARFVVSELVGESCEHINLEGKYKVNFTGDMLLSVMADGDRIAQVVTNFIANAIKYAPGSMEINIDIKRWDQGIRVSVNDHGPGISADKIPHLFDRYYRADSSGSQYSGLGLGLYICSEIIKKHEGEIGVESALGKGSSFWFTLPG